MGKYFFEETVWIHGVAFACSLMTPIKMMVMKLQVFEISQSNYKLVFEDVWKIKAIELFGELKLEEILNKDASFLQIYVEYVCTVVSINHQSNCNMV